MSNPSDYTVGWICATRTEFVAAKAFLNEWQGIPENPSWSDDGKDYALGKIGKHNVVIGVLMEGDYGENHATVVATDMLVRFPNVRIGLMVGIGGGAPSQKNDIRLGDVVVGVPYDGKGGVIQYDLGKATKDLSFHQMGPLGQPPLVLLTAVDRLQARYKKEGYQLGNAINNILESRREMRKKYKRPNSSSDRLYRSGVIHPWLYSSGHSGVIHRLDGEVSCETVCGNNVILRADRTRDEDNPAVHYGLIASASRLMEDAALRDKLIAEKDVLCFEMEANGLTPFPCLVIRGICDYSDSHRNKEWQGYAAMTAAAYAKCLIYQIPPSEIEAEKKISPLLSSLLDTLPRTIVRSKLDTYEEVAILNWLTPINYGPQQRDYIRRRQKGTGQWLLDSDEYQTWLKSSKQTLFCHGIPGAGKTILTSIVVNDLIRRSQNNLNVGVAYLYCNVQSQREQKIEELLISLVKQLSQGLSSLPKSVKALYGYRGMKPTRLLLYKISGALQSVASIYPRVFIIIDALDECQTTSCLAELVSEIFNLQAKAGVNIFATSRFVSETTEKFRGSTLLEISASSQDMRRYLDAQMFRLPEFVIRSPELQEEIKTQIIRADGTFLLVQLHFESLIEKMTPEAICTALQKLPRGPAAYNNAYKNAMERIKRQPVATERLAIQVLSWVTCAKKPLTTSELQHALAVAVGQFSKLDKENFARIEDIVSACAGLVTVDEESQIIRLVHCTAYEYFEQTRADWFPNAEIDIAKSCAIYLSFDTFRSGFCQTDKDFEERLQSYPLYDYAAHNWGHHTRKASTLCREVLDFLECKPNVEASSQALMAIKPYSPWESDYCQKVPRNMTALHLVAYFGIHEAANTLLFRQCPDLKDSLGRTPLSWAAITGHEIVAESLLAHGVNPEPRDKDRRTPLLLAAQCGHKGVVELLLKEDVVNLETYDTDGQTPLLLAVQERHEAVIELLLAKGANLETQDEGGRTPLLLAINTGHTSIVKQLLSKGANPESQDKDGNTPLQLAAIHGQEAVIKLLLENTRLKSRNNSSLAPLFSAIEGGHTAVIKMLLANIGNLKLQEFSGMTPLLFAVSKRQNAVIELLLEEGFSLESESKYGQTPLLFAANSLLRNPNAYDAIIRLLLDKGANLESRDMQGRTPLSFAAHSGNEAIVKLLLEKGAIVDSQDMHGRTPLSFAAGGLPWPVLGGHEAVVKLLLEKGADIMCQDKDGRRPLSFAANGLPSQISGGNEAVVKLLLENGTSLKSKDKEYGNIQLLAAAQVGHLAVVKLLLTEGTNMEFQDKDGLTPLLLAARHGRKAVVTLLLEKHANPECRDKDGRTSLLLAALNGQKEVVKELLTKGANTKCQDKYGQTPLSLAARGGHEAVVELLLVKGFNIQSEDKNGQTPLSLAAEQGEKAVVKLLLKNNANLECRDKDGQTPLLLAAQEGHKAVVKILLAKGANTECQDKHGRTPLSLAEGRRHKAVAELLLAKIAEVNC